MSIGVFVLGLLVVVNTSVVKNDTKNLARQTRVDGIQQASIWLGDALTNATSRRSAPGAAAIEIAEPTKIVFTSALPVEGASQTYFVSRVTLVLGEECWTGQPAEAGVLRRCVQQPIPSGPGAGVLCAKGGPNCPDTLFRESIVARGVRDDKLFGYSLQTVNGPGAPVTAVPDPVDKAQIVAVEFTVTVGGANGTNNADITATLFKRYPIKGWSKL
jgi:hypothetical protein